MHSIKNFLIAFLILCMGVQSAAFAQYSNLPSIGDGAGGELSPLMEYQIGVQIMRQIRMDPDYINDEVITEYLNDIGSKLVNAAADTRGDAVSSFFFFALRDSSLNAFALPGGFIGIHTGLLIAAQSESELASVMSHEIGHVTQRHIARMFGQQKRDMLLPIASIVLGIIAGMSANADAAGAIVMGGQGLAIQKQLNFSRDAEREADRVGFQILREAGFDTNGMVLFFERMQKASRHYSEGFSSYLRTHPLTTERIADIEARVRSESYRQHADNVDFHFIKARARLLQDKTSKGMDAAEAEFAELIKTGGRLQTATGKYGMALIALEQKEAARASALLSEARQAIGENAARKSLALTVTTIDVRLAGEQQAQAVQEAAAALRIFPTSRALAHQYAVAMFEAQQYKQAIEYLRKQAQLYRSDATVRNLLAKVYGAQGKIALMHIELAEAYSLGGGFSAALEQLTLARQAPDVTFYEHSIIDAREREWKARRLEQLGEK